MATFELVKEPQIALFVVSIVFTLTNIPFVILRFIARRRSWGRFGMSDAALLAALLCTTAMCSCIAAACVNAGVGWHGAEAVLTHGFGFLPTHGKMVMAVSQLWAASVFFTKLSILLLLSELFSVVRYLRTATRITMGFAVALWLAQLIGGLTICLPLWNWWTITSVEGWCGRAQRQLFISASIVHTITDIVVMVLPVPCLWALKLPVKTRVGLILVFSGGLIATIVSIGRIVALSGVDWSDVTYSEWESMLFSVLEPSIGIWIACVPHIRAFFARKSARGNSVQMGSGDKLASARTEFQHTKSSSVGTGVLVA